MHRSIRYALDTFKDCFDQEKKQILAFTIRTTDGTDESYSAKRAEAKGSNLTEELIRYSLVSYVRLDDGDATEVEIKQPFEGFDKWSTKARNFVVAAWKRLSTPDELEIADFFKSATENE